MTRELLKQKISLSFKKIGEGVSAVKKTRIMDGIMAYYDYVNKSGVDTFTMVSQITKIYIGKLKEKHSLRVDDNQPIGEFVYEQILLTGLSLLEKPVEYRGYPEIFRKQKCNEIPYENAEFDKYFIKDKAAFNTFKSSIMEYCESRGSSNIDVDALKDIYYEVYKFSLANKHSAKSAFNKNKTKKLGGANNE